MKIRLSKRHIAKTISWRVLGSIDTLIISWIISGNLNFGLMISGYEIISKIILYYVHEQIWFKSKYIVSKKRHIYKTITWRIIGSFDTIVISTIITGNPFTGFKIGGIETISKMLLYYIHEKAWYKIKYGLEKYGKYS